MTTTQKRVLDHFQCIGPDGRYQLCYFGAEPIRGEMCNHLEEEYR